MKLLILFSALFFMARKILATENLSPADKKKLIDKQEIKETLEITVENLRNLIKLETNNFHILSNLKRTNEVEAQENLSIERLIILEEQLEKLSNESEALNSKTMATEEVNPSLTGKSEDEGSEETGGTGSSVNKAGSEVKNITTEPDIPQEATTSTKNVQPKDITEKAKRKESKVTSEPQSTTKDIEPQTSKKLEFSSPKGEGLRKTRKRKKKQAKNVSPEHTGAEVAQESSVSTGEMTEPSTEDVRKPDDDNMQNNGTSSGADTVKNEVEAKNRMSEFLWLLLIMCIIGFVFSTLWVLLN